MIILSNRTGARAFSLMVFTLILVAAGAGFASESAGAGHHVDSAVRMKDFGWRVVDFLALAAIIWWGISKAKVKQALVERQAQIETGLREAENARENAERKLREYTEKIEKASREIGELRATIVREGEQEKQRIIDEAHRAAEKIAAQATLSAEQEVLKARMVLQAEAGRLAVEIAAGKLAGTIGKKDHDQFVGDYLGKVGLLQ